jgi:hypothetical protein
MRRDYDCRRLKARTCANHRRVAELDNGDLLAAAERKFEAFITTGKNLRYQQNLSRRQLAIVVLPTTSWPEIQKRLAMISDAVKGLKPGDFVGLKF